MSSFIIIALLVSAYLVARCIIPSGLPVWVKVLLSLITAAVAFKFQIIRLLGGPQFFAPRLPGLVIVMSGMLYTAVTILALMLFAWDIVRLAAKIALRRTIRTPVVLFLIISLLTAYYGLYSATAVPGVSEYVLTLKNLPSDFTPMRVAVLTDLHLDPFTRRQKLERIVEKTMAARPDLVVLLGDYADGDIKNLGGEVEPLRDLKAPLGVYAISGNHEYYNGWPEWRERLQNLGLNVLENAHVTLANGIILAGVTDVMAMRRNLEPTDVRKAVQGLPQNSCIILLAHRPSVRYEAEREGVALQLSGHTHGGMVRGLDAIVAKHNAGAVAGLYKSQTSEFALFVSTGVSLWNGFPVRLGVPAEIPILKIVPKSRPETAGM